MTHLCDMSPEELERELVDVAVAHNAKMQEMREQAIQNAADIAEFNERSIFAMAAGRVASHLEALAQGIVGGNDG